jgi:hypothetical protein
MEGGRRIKEGTTLKDNARERLVRGLNLNLANMTSLATAYKQAHWNLQGAGFAQLHELFDRFADQTREYADLVAERAVTLFGTAHGTVEGAVKETTLPPFTLRASRRRAPAGVGRARERGDRGGPEVHGWKRGRTRDPGRVHRDRPRAREAGMDAEVSPDGLRISELDLPVWLDDGDDGEVTSVRGPGGAG